MSFGQAVVTCLRKYAQFSGRARRSEFWWYFLFQTGALTLAKILDVNALGADSAGWGPLQLLATFALLLPDLAVTARRLHDTNRSGWWMLILVVPLVGLVTFVVFAVQDSVGDNRYGPSPKPRPWRRVAA